MKNKKFKEFDKTVVSFIFDDMLESICKNVYPIFEELNIKGCVATWAGKLENNTALDIDDMENLRKSGWEFLCHGYNSEVLSDNSSDEIIDCEIVESKKLFDRYGIDVKGYVPSNNLIPQKAIDRIKENYAFMTYAQKWMPNTSETNIYELDRISIEKNSVQEIKGLIDDALINKSYIVFYCHNVGEEYLINVDNFKEIVNYIQEKEIEIRTMSEFLEEYYEDDIINARGKADVILSNNIIRNPSMINLPNANGWQIMSNTAASIKSVNFINKVKEFEFDSETGNISLLQNVPIEFDTLRFVRSENVKFRFSLPFVSSKSKGQVKVVINAYYGSNKFFEAMNKTYSCYKYLRFVEEDFHIGRRDASINKLQVIIYVNSNSTEKHAISIGEPCLQIYNCKNYNCGSSDHDDYNKDKLFGQLVLTKNQNVVSNNSAVTIELEKDALGTLEVKDNLWHCTKTGTYKVEFQVELRGTQDITDIKLYIGMRKNLYVLAMSKYYDFLSWAFSKTINLVALVNVNEGSNIEFFFTNNTNKTVMVMGENTRAVITQIL
ncbi:MAG: hypothetical protein E7214_03320 [Clostridium sp.]|nr:hypothetical protein [Clostridium sp.]